MTKLGVRSSPPEEEMSRIIRLFRLVAPATLVAAPAAFAVTSCGNLPAMSTTGSTNLATTTASLTVTETQVATGTTAAEGPDVTRSLTFVGPVSPTLWQTLRAAVMEAGDDGQVVLDKVSALSAGDPVSVGSHELGSLSGIGFSVGAGASQPIGVGRIPEDGDALIFAFTVPGQPEATTIVGFQRGTGRVVLVEGSLPIDDSTQNITTVPAP